MAVSLVVVAAMLRSCAGAGTIEIARVRQTRAAPYTIGWSPEDRPRSGWRSATLEAYKSRYRLRLAGVDGRSTILRRQHIHLVRGVAGCIHDHQVITGASVVVRFETLREGLVEP